jgi:hypothetical protein
MGSEMRKEYKEGRQREGERKGRRGRGVWRKRVNREMEEIGKEGEKGT